MKAFLKVKRFLVICRVEHCQSFHKVSPARPPIVRLVADNDVERRDVRHRVEDQTLAFLKVIIFPLVVAEIRTNSASENRKLAIRVFQKFINAVILELVQIRNEIHKISDHASPLFFRNNICLAELRLQKRLQRLALISSLVRFEKLNRSIAAVQKACYVLHPRVIPLNLFRRVD